jgi:hypothetical protein
MNRVISTKSRLFALSVGLLFSRSVKAAWRTRASFEPAGDTHVICGLARGGGGYCRRQLLAAAPERQYLASLRSGFWDLLANDKAATYLDASFVAAIFARR